MTAARVATDQLTRALLDMAAPGKRTHCLARPHRRTAYPHRC
jgi:hypothetical protein